MGHDNVTVCGVTRVMGHDNVTACRPLRLPSRNLKIWRCSTLPKTLWKIWLEQQNYKFVPLQKSTLGWALQWTLHFDCFWSFERFFAWAYRSSAVCTRCSTFLMETSAKSPGIKKWWPRCLNLNIASAVVLSADRHSNGGRTYKS